MDACVRNSAKVKDMIPQNGSKKAIYACVMATLFASAIGVQEARADDMCVADSPLVLTHEAAAQLHEMLVVNGGDATVPLTLEEIEMVEDLLYEAELVDEETCHQELPECGDEPIGCPPPDIRDPDGSFNCAALLRAIADTMNAFRYLMQKYRVCMTKGNPPGACAALRHQALMMLKMSQQFQWTYDEYCLSEIIIEPLE
jgi:hypothetical protein